MSWPLLYLYAGLVAASVAAASYGVWSIRWAKKSEWLLSLLNGLIAVVGVALVIAHLLSLTEPILSSIRLQRTPAPLLWGDILLILPAMSRLFELRRDKTRDALREVISEQIKSTRGSYDSKRDNE